MRRRTISIICWDAHTSICNNRIKRQHISGMQHQASASPRKPSTITIRNPIRSFTRRWPGESWESLPKQQRFSSASSTLVNRIWKIRSASIISQCRCRTCWYSISTWICVTGFTVSILIALGHLGLGDERTASKAAQRSIDDGYQSPGARAHLKMIPFFMNEVTI